MNSLGDTVTLTLSSSLVPNKGYLLQINYVQDLAGTPMVVEDLPWSGIQVTE